MERRRVLLPDNYDYHDDYIDLNYIQSNGCYNGATYFPTGVYFTQDMYIEICHTGKTNYWDKLFNSNSFLLEYEGYAIGGYSWQSSGTRNRIVGNRNVRSIAKHITVYDNGDFKDYVNGVLDTLGTNQSIRDGTGEIAMLGIQNGDGSNIKFHYCIMKQNGILIRDYIPVRNKATGVYGIYDKVNKTFAGNSGKTPFTGG